MNAVNFFKKNIRLLELVVMSRFTKEQLEKRIFERAAWVMKHIWEEQQDDPKRAARMHSRLFDILVGNPRVLGTSKRGGGHKEHLVPCALLRDRAFEMYWDGKSEQDVAEMFERFLVIAHIHPDEAHHLDHRLGLKTTMPESWDWDTGLVEARLIEAGIELE